MRKMTTWSGCDIYLHLGDITTLEVDAVVNAANSGLRAGSGVCGAIHRTGGPAIAAECKAIVTRRGEIPTGEAAITTGGNLPARHVIHAVGPVYTAQSRNESAALLAAAYRNSLETARASGLSSIAFPCLSTGVYGYPPNEAAPVALEAVRGNLEKCGGLNKVVFCVFLQADHDIYARLLGG